MIEYSEVLFQDLKDLIGDNYLLLVTATDLETSNTHLKMRPLDGKTHLLKAFENDLTFVLGVFGNYLCIHVQCAMGAMSRSSSIVTITDTLNILQPKLVLMPGIAFGINKSKQNIGDVLIAEVVYPYNFKRIGSETIQRGIPLVANKTLVNRFKSIIPQWEFILDNTKKAEITCVAMLSGEELVDNKRYRDALVKEFRNVKGGEMEGAGVYAACNDKVPCVLAKSICDFADGEKEINKNKNQQLAIETSLSACLELFASKTAFISLGLLPYVKENLKVYYNENAQQILFDVYDISKEKYYIKRDADAQFISVLNLYSIWIYGLTGCGKSNLILRNLIYNKIDFLYISLASCVNCSIDNLIKEVYIELVLKFNAVYNEPSSFTQCSKQIIQLLETYCSNKKLIIFIEEIPISEDSKYKDFCEKIFSLLIGKSFIAGLKDIKFILSSIANPQNHIPIFNQKIHQHLKFVEQTNWTDKEIKELIVLINGNIQLNLKKKVSDALEIRSKGSPRFIKKYFRNVLINEKISDEILEQTITITEVELSQI